MLLVSIAAVLAGCGQDDNKHAEQKPALDPAFLVAQNDWRAQRRDDLLRPDGWTSLVGLHQIQLKAHYVGTGPGSGIRLAVGPDKLGMITDGVGHVRFTPEKGVPVTFNGEPLTKAIDLADDRQPTPGVIGFDEGKGLLSVIERGDRHYLRVKHADAPSRLQFTGIGYWDADPSWQVQARYIPHPAGKTLPIMDIISVVTPSPNPGAVEFERDGKTYRLEALGEPGGELFFVLADRTSGHGSYPAGRFLDAPAPVDGKVTLDFNQAYNPPCAFTPFATCPLPPPENRLDLAITAGEKQYLPPKQKKS
ncbi:hypothetical protein GCM10007235_29830 [Pseudoxanthomonas indica]|nr:hypothetical protein GCM10007235_29830 [Pseudoxanthomonas indica]